MTTYAFVEKIVGGTSGIIYKVHLLRIAQMPYMDQTFLEVEGQVRDQRTDRVTPRMQDCTTPLRLIISNKNSLQY